MDAFELLRQQAADKLDKAIKAARDEYRAEVAKINELRAALGYENPLGLRTRKRIGDMLEEHYPSDRTFTVDEIVATTQAAYPDIRFRRDSVRSAMQRHKEQGIIRRVCKQDKGTTIWAVADLAVTEVPYGAMSFADVAEEILVGSQGMRPAELVVAMQTAGYRQDDDPAHLVRKVTQSLGINPKRFQRDARGKWRLVV